MRQVAALVAILAAMLTGIGILFTAPSRLSEEVIVMLGVAFATSLAVILRGPLGKALVGSSPDEIAADKEWRARISGQIDEVLDELREVRQDSMDLQERVDFAERLLTRTTDPKHLEKP
jgi:hypothetical protein